jgi:hypothetical protein
MPTLFRVNDFSGGLNTQLDAAKTTDASYPLCINGRVRRNVVAPTPRHVKLSIPSGLLQGLYITGDFLVLFIAGVAYRADVNVDPMLFTPVGNWTPMSATAPRIQVELVPASSNMFNRTGSPDLTTRTFNSAVAIFPQALFCFDGVSQPQAILPNGTAIALGTYAAWTKDDPNYVPIGLLPAFASNKLFLADPVSQNKIFHSVSGRAFDFVVNIDNAGDKGGDADTVSTAVSLNPITSIRSLSTGQVLVGTLYGTHILTLDYTNTIFGEPFLQPDFLFPAGPINEISIVDILEDTAFITQSGIHAFNVVAQAKRESNNYPLGAKIRGLITDPITNKSITQSQTCAGLYDDYAFFAVNTIYGYGCVVYDTITKTFHALDLSFGHVKQFATTRLAGVERLFYITHDNEIFEAFASSERNATRIYLGEWTPEAAGSASKIRLVNLVFTTVRTSGQVKISVYSDRELIEDAVIEVTAPEFDANVPIPIPFPNSKQAVPVNYQMRNQVRAWKIGLLIEWNFDGQLSDVAIDGTVEVADNVDMTVPVAGVTENVVFIAESGYVGELNVGGVFPAAGYRLLNVTEGARYIYDAGANGVLVNGGDRIESGLFIARAATVAVKGTAGAAATFSLRVATNYMAVLDAIVEEDPVAIIHGGGFAYTAGTAMDVKLAKLPLRHPIYACPGVVDIATASGAAFFNALGIPRHYSKDFQYLDFYFMNGNASEPDGIGTSSVQAGMIRDWALHSQGLYKILVVNIPLYSNDAAAPSGAALSWLTADLGIHAVFSGGGRNMERFVVNSFPYFVCGAGGQVLRTLGSTIPAAYQNDIDYGYLSITADALTCKLEFKNTSGEVLDYYALYA